MPIELKITSIEVGAPVVHQHLAVWDKILRGPSAMRSRAQPYLSDARVYSTGEWTIVWLDSAPGPFPQRRGVSPVTAEFVQLPYLPFKS